MKQGTILTFLLMVVMCSISGFYFNAAVTTQDRLDKLQAELRAKAEEPTPDDKLQAELYESQKRELIMWSEIQKTDNVAVRKDLERRIEARFDEQ